MRNIFTLFAICILLFQTEYVSAQYCQPDYSFTPFGCSDANGGDVINSFYTTGGISNITNMNTGCNGDYTYWSALTASQVAGSAITLNMQAGPTFAEWFRVWIDYNNDFDFLDPGEDVYASATASNALLTQTITIPIGTAPGVKRMRVMCKWGGTQMAVGDYCSTAFTFGECEDYNLMVLPLAVFDPAVYFISQPAGNCFSANQQLQVRLKNYGSSPIVLGPNAGDKKIQVQLNVNGPAGLTVYDTLLTSGTLPAMGADSLVALFLTPFNNALNLFAGGSYSINSSLVAINFVNGSILDDSLATPISLLNYRPTAGPTYNLCQGSTIPFGQGLTVSGCATPIKDSITLTFQLLGPCMDNIGATGGGTSPGPPANCSNDFACLFASTTIPTLPVGSSFYQPAILTVTNLATIGSSFASEVRMNLYGTAPSFPTLYSPGAQGATGATNPLFTYSRPVSTADMSAIYTGLPANGTLNVGYWESYNDIVAGTDLTLNSSGPTVVTLKFYYQYVPPSFEWYDVASGGSSLYSLTPFNPLSVPNAVVNNSNVPGNYVFYAACVGSSVCRIPDTLRILPAPAVFQDTITTCESLSSSNTAIIDLTAIDGFVSGGFPVDSVRYFYDQATTAMITPANADTTGSVILYSKVYLGQCASTDSVIVNVFNTPSIALTTNSAIICAPAIGNVLDYINPFSYSPTGTDTLYYQDASCTLPFVQPNVLTATDSIYIVFATNTAPVCSDTIGLYVDISSSSNLIVNQSNLNISNCSSSDPIPTAFKNFADGQLEDLRNQADCRKIVGVHDLPNGISLGGVTVNEEIDCPDPIYNNLPYLNRHFEITPTTQDSARICLYVLDEDIASFNLSAQIGGYQGFLANLSNLCVHKIDNGPITSPQMVLTQLDAANSNLTISYDPTYTVYSICFDVANFSYFFCTTCSAIPLPVNWSHFTAKRVDQTSVLNWVTAQELNSDYFMVERSRDGKNFQAISNMISSQAINGNSATPLSYDFIDQSPIDGHNYYRILQTDKDNKTSYSQVKDVYFAAETIVNVYPNPVGELLNLDIMVSKSTTANIQLLDATGRIVRQMNSMLSTGSNSLSMDVKDLANGIYLIKLSNDKGLNFTQTIRKK